MLSTGHSCRVSDFLWLVTESTLLPPEQIFTQIEKNISKYFRRNLTEFSNNDITIVTKKYFLTGHRKYPAATRAHFHSKLKNKIFFQYFRRRLTKFLNHAITIVTQKYFLNGHRKYPAANRAHSHSKLKKKIFCSIFSSKFNKCFMKMFKRYHKNCLQEIWPQKIARWKSNFETICKLFLIIKQYFFKLLKGCHYGRRYASDL